MAHRILAALLLALAVLILPACQQEAPKAAQDQAVAPTDPTDSMAWRKYVQAVAKTYAPSDQNSRFYAIYTDYQQDAEKTARQIEQIKTQIAPGLAQGTLLMYASPDSALIAEIIEKAYENPRADALKGTKVIFVGKAAEAERVKAAVGAWGAEFVLHEVQ
jgi:outer membrane biogenesis lipoprotein LolB